MSNIAFLFLPLAFSSLPTVLPFVFPSSQVVLHQWSSRCSATIDATENSHRCYRSFWPCPSVPDLMWRLSIHPDSAHSPRRGPGRLGSGTAALRRRLGGEPAVHQQPPRCQCLGPNTQVRHVSAMIGDAMCP